MAKDSQIDEIAILTQEEFSKYPPALNLSMMFYEKDLPYIYEDYLIHVAMTKSLADKHSHYKVKFTSNNAFRNIQIFIHEKKWVMVSKGKSPAINFAIHHPKLTSAIENMVVPVIEK